MRTKTTPGDDFCVQSTVVNLTKQIDMQRTRITLQILSTSGAKGLQNSTTSTSQSKLYITQSNQLSCKDSVTCNKSHSKSCPANWATRFGQQGDRIK